VNCKWGALQQREQRVRARAVSAKKE